MESIIFDLLAVLVYVRIYSRKIQKKYICKYNIKKMQCIWHYLQMILKILLFDNLVGTRAVYMQYFCGCFPYFTIWLLINDNLLN